ncbi:MULTISPECIES: hypothetical protein [Sutcliffiella]|uniref:Uncharacterized protein n=1 Tax=Sutcliffiella cohnii TaxID=33932 RepID=A0A223KLW7_9BACI|nr:MULTISPECIES: hypothetical protein [Sutcliffiella]AST90368.1 hypothetical protein BC6307_03325 [Sutcliffiella cohnii]WBL16023.1 hypothetical protein O1A01_05150 [Sutcliffiella sp. NC1]
MQEIEISLQKHNIRVIEKDVPYVREIVSIIHQAQASLEEFPTINEEVPIVVVDPEVIKFD